MTSWEHQAGCKDSSPDLFFPAKTLEWHGRRARVTDNDDEALQICGTCIVRIECREFAIANRTLHGVWGGLKEDQLRRLVGRRKKAQ